MILKQFYYKKIKSTNDTALKYISKGVENGIIITDVQTKGKGQIGKKWISLKGNLFMSVFFQLRNKVSIKKITKVNCLLIRNCLQKYTNYEIKVKQPNDLLINNQKICGILQETIYRNKKKFLVVGIGVNINKSPRIDRYQTNFLNFFTKKNVKRLEVFDQLSNIYEKKINQFS